MGRGVDGVGDPITWRGAEQGVHGVKHLPGDDHVPFPQQASSILTLLPFKNNVPAKGKRCNMNEWFSVMETHN